MNKDFESSTIIRPPCCRKLEGGIKNRGMRMTIPRQLIARVLGASERYLSAEEIFIKIKENYPAIGMATVYRTLVLMEDLGLINRHNFGEGRCRFFVIENNDEKHFCQFICESCFRVMKFSNSLTEDFQLYQDIEDRIVSNYGFDINKRITQYYGLCPDCKNNKTGDSK